MVTFDVTNTGHTAGAEVAQLYIGDQEASVPRPVKELKEFTKVFLEPGETKTISFVIDKTALSYFDQKSRTWRCEPGIFEVLVGNSSGNCPLKDQFKFED
jgi:beta-glucosidase